MLVAKLPCKCFIVQTLRMCGAIAPRLVNVGTRLKAVEGCMASLAKLKVEARGEINLPGIEFRSCTRRESLH